MRDSGACLRVTFRRRAPLKLRESLLELAVGEIGQAEIIVPDRELRIRFERLPGNLDSRGVLSRAVEGDPESI